MIGLRRILSSTPSRLVQGRSYATGSQLVNVTVDDKTGISTLSMNSMPVNSLNRKLLSALHSSLQDVLKNKSRGVILTSALPTIFSAGLDITEMYNKDEQNLKDFWNTVQETWLAIYGLEIPIAAGINGHSPAGGCMMSISCEYRVMVDGKYQIGLNETLLGMVAPKWFMDPYIDTIGYRNAELLLLKGGMCSPSEALKIGLVDELATDKEDTVRKCEEYIKSFSKISPYCRSVTKLQLRSKLLDWMKQNREEDTKFFVRYIQEPKVQANIKMYLEALKKRKQ